MLQILHAFARSYRSSASGRCGSANDYTIDYEKFLRSAGVADGDDREIAEKELLAAEAQSSGLFCIDRNPRSNAKLRLRLAHDGGEAWLFAQIGEATPTAERELLASYFEEVSGELIPELWRDAWHQYFQGLACKARDGDSIQPFRRDDSEGNVEIINALIGVLYWNESSLVRYASTRICGDSKRLQALEPRLRVVLEQITGHRSFEPFGIFRKPRFITFHGPLVLPIGDTTVDFSIFPAPVTLSEGNFNNVKALFSSAPLCLTVENEDVFHELAATNPGVLLILTSFPGSAALGLIARLPSTLPFHHFGDSDPAGNDILRDLREKTGRTIRPVLMHYRKSESADNKALSAHELMTLKRLLNQDSVEDIRPQIEGILKMGDKGSFEQEGIPVAEVWEKLAPFLNFQA